MHGSPWEWGHGSFWGAVFTWSGAARCLCEFWSDPSVWAACSEISIVRSWKGLTAIVNTKEQYFTSKSYYPLNTL